MSEEQSLRDGEEGRVEMAEGEEIFGAIGVANVGRGY